MSISPTKPQPPSTIIPNTLQETPGRLSNLDSAVGSATGTIQNANRISTIATVGVVACIALNFVRVAKNFVGLTRQLKAAQNETNEAQERADSRTVETIKEIEKQTTYEFAKGYGLLVNIRATEPSLPTEEVTGLSALQSLRTEFWQLQKEYGRLDHELWIAQSEYEEKGRQCMEVADKADYAAELAADVLKRPPPQDNPERKKNLLEQLEEKKNELFRAQNLRRDLESLVSTLKEERNALLSSKEPMSNTIKVLENRLRITESIPERSLREFFQERSAIAKSAPKEKSLFQRKLSLSREERLNLLLEKSLRRRAASLERTAESVPEKKTLSLFRERQFHGKKLSMGHKEDLNQLLKKIPEAEKSVPEKKTLSLFRESQLHGKKLSTGRREEMNQLLKKITEAEKKMEEKMIEAERLKTNIYLDPFREQDKFLTHRLTALMDDVSDYHRTLGYAKENAQQLHRDDDLCNKEKGLRQSIRQNNLDSLYSQALIRVGGAPSGWIKEIKNTLTHHPMNKD